MEKLLKVRTSSARQRRVLVEGNWSLVGDGGVKQLNRHSKGEATGAWKLKINKKEVDDLPGGP